METHFNATLVRVVDGDTVRVKYTNEGTEVEESLRLLGLDTEESNPGGGKPVTPWGKEAKKEAERFFSAGDQVTLTFPGNEPLDVCLKKYRGNFGRLLVYISKDGVDFQEHQIKLGFSPYFVKYGYVNSGARHATYTDAERIAQSEHAGVWNQILVNGSEVNNYAVLTTWWHLRARVINEYRKLKADGADVLNTRLDFSAIVDRAQADQEGVVFTELKGAKRITDNHFVINIGSKQQPFSLFLPNAAESDAGRQILSLLEHRYLGSANSPRRSYAYVKGKMSMFNDKPQMIVASADQIQDWLR